MPPGGRRCAISCIARTADPAAHRFASTGPTKNTVSRRGPCTPRIRGLSMSDVAHRLRRQNLFDVFSHAKATTSVGHDHAPMK